MSVNYLYLSLLRVYSQTVMADIFQNCVFVCLHFSRSPLLSPSPCLLFAFSSQTSFLPSYPSLPPFSLRNRYFIPRAAASLSKELRFSTSSASRRNFKQSLRQLHGSFFRDAQFHQLQAPRWYHIHSYNSNPSTNRRSSKSAECDWRFEMLSFLQLNLSFILHHVFIFLLMLVALNREPNTSG